MSVWVGVFTLAVLLVLASFVGKAQAAPETIAESGSGAGQVDFPVGVAVDQTSGDFYVAENNNGRISKFDSEGHFLLAWGFGVRDGETAELQTCGPQAVPPQSWCFKSPFNSNDGAGNVVPDAVAVDQSSHDVYVADSIKHRITKFTEAGQFVYLVGGNVNATKVALGAGATQAEKNICTAESGDICTSGTSGTEPNEFVSPRSLAITPSGTVWVGDTSRLKSFDENGVAGPEITGGGIAGGENTFSLALDSAGDFYVWSASFAGIRKLEAGTGTLLQTLDETGKARTVATDEADNVYIGDQTSPYRFKIYDPAGNQTLQFGAGEVIGTPGFTNTISGSNAIAVGEGVERLYVASSQPASAESVVQAFPLPEPGPLVVSQDFEDLEPTSATLTGAINPENHQTTYRFEYDTSPYGEGESGHGTSVPVPDATLTAEGFEAETVAAHLEQLIPATTYHFRLCATNSLGEACGRDTAFSTLPAVVIEPEWVSNLSAHSATLNAELNPLGVEAEAWLEWGTDEGYGQVVPLANLGEGFDPVLRQATLTGLQAAATYHYRFTARDTRDGNVYTVHGADRTFTTQFGGLGFQLADGRAWEMVSPPDKHGARLVSGGENPLQAAADGEGLAYQSYLSTEADPEGNRIVEPSMNLARRQGDGSWRSKDITPPNEYVKPITIGQGTEYKFFNPALSKALLEPRSGTPLSPEASPERAPYLRENTEPPAYTPLVTGKEPYANVPPGTEFGGGLDESGHEKTIGAVQLAAVSPDFRHFGLRSRVPLVNGAPSGGETLYEWSGGQIDAISVLPPAEGGEIVHAQLIGSGPASVRGALSDDGSRAFWSVGSSPSTISALYLRYSATQAPSAMIHAGGTGTVTVGSSQVTSLIAAAGTGDLTEGSAEVTSLVTSSGSFLVGQPIAGAGIPAGATITAVSGTTLTLSAAVEAGQSGTGVALSSEGPAPFAVGQTIAGAGIPAGTTITAVAPGSLTLSAQATASHTEEALEADSPCLESEKACTVRIDVKRPGASGIGPKNPIFQGANADGTVVFFTDSQQLTEGAGSPSGADLYRCEIPAGSPAAGCATLTDISVPTGARESAEVQGLAPAVSADGTRVYFVATGVLDDSPNKLGEAAVSGQPNLYVWQQGEGVRFIATLTAEDRTDWGEKSASEIFAGALTATASPTGRYLGFMSQRSLTGFDNRDESSGEAAQEVFRYDAAAEQLQCVSCDPTGARPHSAVPEGFSPFIDSWNIWKERLLAATLPEATSTTNLGGGGVSLYHPRAVLDNGRVFFNAVDSLVPADSNGQWDVYQYEPTGVGDCSASSGGASVSRSAGGCVSLISSGTAEEEAAFLDADEMGDNVFFWTPAQLNETDIDNEFDIYDARVDGIPATLPKITECLGEACQPAAKVPSDPTPASSAFNGAGNVKPARKHCGKGKRLVRRNGKARCVSRRHRHKHKRSGGKSRRAHR